ncbi:MAG: hypothetical protein FJX57_03980 [Alphaproteobacteria bacterium]|nr:hypothetical protein [Alphaproteobacteria bacterium]
MTEGREENPAIDWIGGAALGLLLGLLIGLSVTPVVSIVVTALVGLLAGLFGLNDKLPLGITATGARRLAAFGLVAVVATPVAIWMRTHDVLGPSLDDQRAILRKIGYPDDSPEHKAVLLSLRFGIDTTAKPQVAEGARRAGSGVLYGGEAAALCGKLQMSGATGDLLTVLDGASDAKHRALAPRIRALPADKQAAALDYARLFLCESP